MNNSTAPKRPSIRRKLIEHLIVWCLFMTLTPTVLVYFDAAHEVDELFDASLVQTSKVLDRILTRKSIENNKKHIDEYLLAKDNALVTDHHHYEKKVAFQLIDKNGIVVKSASAPKVELHQQQEGFSETQSGDFSWVNFSLYSKENQWWLVVSERSDIRAEIAFDIVRDHVLPLLIFIPILLILVRWLINRGFMPLQDVIRQVNQRQYKHLETINQKTAPEEVNALLSALNNLLLRLNASYKRESQFVSDASHEIRTPLAGILLQTDNLIEDSEDVQLTKDLLEIKHGIQRLSHMSKQLLDASRADMEDTEDNTSTVDLCLLCHEVLPPLEKLAAEKKQTLTIDLDDKPCLIKAQQGNIQSLISNLVDNAIRYTPEGGSIRLSCRNIDNKIVLTVSDSGPGIPEAEYENVKRRFHRLNSHNRNGSGLGLAIVAQVVKTTNAQWQLSRAEEGGLLNTISFEE